MNKAAYPLSWPPGWPKTEILKKESGKFQQTLAGALNTLKIECQRLGGKNLILSSNYTLGAENPKESGVVAYFELDNNHIAIPCDRWQKVEHNVRAIALTIEAVRGMERWGAKHMIKAMFSGFKMLPAAPSKNWWEVLEVNRTDAFEVVRDSYRRLAKIHHPDTSGSNADKFRQVQEAWEQFEQNR